MRPIAATLFAVTALVATGATANADLAKKSNCLACHTIDRKLVGPAYQEVAKKYAADKGAEARLIDKVKKGGVGVWGNVPMPPNSTVKDEDIKTLVKWVLSGAK
jgi:cytochrome c